MVVRDRHKSRVILQTRQAYDQSNQKHVAKSKWIKKMNHKVEFHAYPLLVPSHSRGRGESHLRRSRTNFKLAGREWVSNLGRARS